jgi:predicted DNA-binding transcriptional regulator AlpA
MDNNNFSVNQLKAISLIAIGTNFRQTAKILGIDRSVLWNWRKDTEFQKAIELEKARYVKQYKEDLDSLKKKAISKLSEYLDDPNIPMTQKIATCFDCLNMSRTIEVKYTQL